MNGSKKRDDHSAVTELDGLKQLQPALSGLGGDHDVVQELGLGWIVGVQVPSQVHCRYRGHKVRNSAGNAECIGQRGDSLECKCVLDGVLDVPSVSCAGKQSIEVREN